MGRKTTRRPGRRQEASGPSIFFWVALAIGLVVLVIMAVVLINRPAIQEPLQRGAANTPAAVRVA